MPREKITDKNKTPKIRELEEIYKEDELIFEFKTVYFTDWGNGSRSYSKTYYEISILDDNKKKIKLNFYAKRGYPTLQTYLEKSFRTGGDKEE